MRDVLTLPEVADYLRVSVHQVRILIREEELIAFNTTHGEERKHWKVRKEDLEKYVAEHISNTK